MTPTEKHRETAEKVVNDFRMIGDGCEGDLMEMIAAALAKAEREGMKRAVSGGWHELARRMRAGGKTLAEIADWIGVSQAAVSVAVKGVPAPSKPVSLTENQARVLRYIMSVSEDGSARFTQHELCAATRIRRGGVHAAIEALANKGLMEVSSRGYHGSSCKIDICRANAILSEAGEG